jgi:hypothetical protein
LADLTTDSCLRQPAAQLRVLGRRHASILARRGVRCGARGSSGAMSVSVSKSARVRSDGTRRGGDDSVACAPRLVRTRAEVARGVARASENPQMPHGEPGCRNVSKAGALEVRTRRQRVVVLGSSRAADLVTRFSAPSASAQMSLLTQSFRRWDS